MSEKKSRTKIRRGRSAEAEEQAAPLTVNRSELIIDGSDNQFREMVHNALAFSVRLGAIRDGYARYIGLTGIQYTIITSIAHLEAEADVGVKELAAHLSLSGTFVTTEVRKLVTKGLISKRPSTSDRRRVRLTTTVKARKTLRELSSIQRGINDVHFEPLSRQDFLRFKKLMKELTLSTDRALVILEHHLRLKEAESR